MKINCYLFTYNKQTFLSLPILPFLHTQSSFKTIKKGFSNIILDKFPFVLNLSTMTIKNHFKFYC